MRRKTVFCDVYMFTSYIYDIGFEVTKLYDNWFCHNLHHTTGEIIPICISFFSPNFYFAYLIFIQITQSWENPT
jgi:hypothetical protein